MKKLIAIMVTVILLTWTGGYAATTVDGVTTGTGGLPACTDAEYTAGTKTDCAGTPANAKVELDKKVPVPAASITDNHILVKDGTGTTGKFKDGGTLAADDSTASHGMYKDSTGAIKNLVTAIDAHAASTTITLIPGICPTIHNTSQADSNIANNLPAVADGLCFIGLITTTENDKTWRLTAASVNTVCLNGTCGKDDIGFATTKVTKGAAFACIAQGTEWFCYTVGSNSTPDAGDL